MTGGGVTKKIKEEMNMAFQLNSVVPWGRNMAEYRQMFLLSNDDMFKKIAGFGDGPASFNYEASQCGYSVTSFDPIYQFTKNEIQNRIEEVRTVVLQQMKENADNYVWKNIRSLDELENIRMSAMGAFLSDYEKGKREKRYIYHELPNTVPYADNAFDIGLSSHFLFMYTVLGYDFHIKAITEMLRVCKEIRIFPIVDLDAHKTDLTVAIIEYFSKRYSVNIQDTEYEFQKGDNQMLIIRK